jgi:predicted naringenin-chalcone synthase
MFISKIRSVLPPFSKTQAEGLNWLSGAYKLYQKTQKSSEDEYKKLLRRVGCSPSQISKRNFFLPDFNTTPEKSVVFRPDKIEGALVRQEFFRDVANKVFADLYENEKVPRHLIHVSCTGYVSPSGAQLVAAQKSPDTTVTHSYHMGCYGAFPALRMASGFLNSPHLHHENPEADIVHTELCTLHMTPADPTLEQMVIQSLFADGVIAYRLGQKPEPNSMELLALGEFLVPNSEKAMEWIVADQGMAMTLSKDVPKLIGEVLRETLVKWEKQTGLPILKELPRTIVAVHPGGPKIIESVQQLLELKEEQVRYSREVLFEHGNMSSATVPHIWKKILEDGSVASGTPVLSMAFGPGLTLCLSLMRVYR